MPVILAIESSCDETSAAICNDGKIVSNIIATQKIHEQYGGVVPELASRAHIQNIVPVVKAALQTSNIQLDSVDAIAFTQSPGLIGSLLVGSQFAKSLSLALDKPLISVHHMQAHVLSNLIDDPKPDFPFLCLTVSGGHTQIVLCHSPTQMKVIGETIDDAAGEAFDKSAKLLGLPYPGGPLIDKYAREGHPKKFSFPEPNTAGLDFSFSGLKTAFLYFVREQSTIDTDFTGKNRNDLCASIQHTIVNILLKKLRKASEQTGINEIAIAGGVSANSGLRNAVTEEAKKSGWNVYIPPLRYCTDNAAMIAVAGYYKFLKNDFAPRTAGPMARMSF